MRQEMRKRQPCQKRNSGTCRGCQIVQLLILSDILAGNVESIYFISFKKKFHHLFCYYYKRHIERQINGMLWSTIRLCFVVLLQVMSGRGSKSHWPETSLDLHLAQPAH